MVTGWRVSSVSVIACHIVVMSGARKKGDN